MFPNQENIGMDVADGTWTNKLYYDTTPGGLPIINDRDRQDLPINGARNITHSWGSNAVNKCALKKNWELLFNFKEHSVNFREHSVNFREHSVNFREH
jgi:hypothetical protein